MKIAPIHKNTPLLSNLDNLENIALIKEVHEHLSRDDAQNLALEALQRIGFDEIAHRRKAECSNVERFVVQLIRASMMEYAKIVVSTPFVLTDDAKRITFFIDMFDKLMITERIELLDMQSNRPKYEKESTRCHFVV